MKKEMKEDWKKIERCMEEHIACWNDMGERMAEDVVFDIELNDSEALYCERCRLLAFGPESFCLESVCKSSTTGEHELALVNNISEREAHSCIDCGGVWFYDPEEGAACKKSKTKVHRIREFVLLCGQKIAKLVRPQEIAIKIVLVENKKQLFPMVESKDSDENPLVL